MGTESVVGDVTSVESRAVEKTRPVGRDVIWRFVSLDVRDARGLAKSQAACKSGQFDEKSTRDGDAPARRTAMLDAAKNGRPGIIKWKMSGDVEVGRFNVVARKVTVGRFNGVTRKKKL